MKHDTVEYSIVGNANVEIDFLIFTIFFDAKKLRFAILGCGFWARYQLPAWLELDEVEPVALYNRTLSKAQALGAQYGIDHCYDSAEALLAKEELDFVDIITDVDTAPSNFPPMTQKPVSVTYLTASIRVTFLSPKKISISS